MRDFVQGQDVVIEAKKDGVYRPFACAEEVNIEMLSEILASSSADSGAWEYNRQSGKNSWNATMTGVTVLKDDIDVLWFGWETFLLQVRSMELDLRMTFTDRNGYSKVAYGKAIIPKSNIGGNATQMDFSRYGIEFTGTGPLDITGFIPEDENNNTEVKRLFWITTGAEPNKVQNNALIGLPLANIKLVGREDKDTWEIIAAGDPGAKQVRLDNVEGSLRFQIDFEATEQVYCLYNEL